MNAQVRAARIRWRSFAIGLCKLDWNAIAFIPWTRTRACCLLRLEDDWRRLTQPLEEDEVEEANCMSVEQLKDRIGNGLSNLRGRPTVSFEFFPPKDEQMEKTLWESIQRLSPLQPRFVSVTYGADGSTRSRTHNIVTRIQETTALTAAPHLTCVGAPREEILEIARNYWAHAIRHIVALRGDPPQGVTQ